MSTTTFFCPFIFLPTQVPYRLNDDSEGLLDQLLNQLLEPRDGDIEWLAAIG